MKLGRAIGGAAAWRGEELFERDDWHVELDSSELAELDAAVRDSRRRAVDDLDAGTPPLPLLGPRLAAVQRSLESGPGAVRLRGLAIDGRDTAELAHLFWAIARRVGTPISQSATGERLLELRDERFAAGDPRVRGPHTNRRLRFHTDRCDVIAFLCVRPAARGGENDVISSVALHDELARRDPDALRTLGGSFPYLRHTVDPANPKSYTMVPVFTVYEGHFAASLLRVLIDRADASPDAPSLSDEQRHALDRLDEVAEDPGLYARFRLEAGDILFLNNWQTFHRRLAFEDHDDPAQRRLLLRLWLSVPNSRPLDPRFEEHFGATAAGALRGGIHPRPDPA